MTIGRVAVIAVNGSDGLTNGDDGTANDPLPANPFARKRVFLTSGSYTGNLRAAGKAETGPEAADNLCSELAASEKLGGKWRAWLSDSQTDAIDRIADVGPWFLLDGTKVFNKKSGLTGSPLVPILLNESGAKVLEGTASAWTGTLANGTKAPSVEMCLSWQLDKGDVSSEGEPIEGVVGSTSVTERWSESSHASCADRNRLYCFEQ